MSDAPTHVGQAVRAARRPTHPLLTRKTDPALQMVRDSVQRRLTDTLLADVADLAAVDALLERDRQHMNSLAASFLSHEAPERKASDAALAASATALQGRLKTLTSAEGPVRHFLVDTADGIFADGGMTLVEIHTGPTPDNNWARVTHDREFHGGLWGGFDTNTASVTFDFTWRNDAPRAVSADVHGYLILNGSAVTLCDGGWISLYSTTMDVTARMALFDLSTNPPTEFPAQDGASALAAHLECSAVGFFETGGIDGRDISSGFDLQHLGAVVQAGGQLRVHLTFEAGYTIINGGRVQVGFATAPRRVLTPGILIAATDL